MNRRTELEGPSICSIGADFAAYATRFDDAPSAPDAALAAYCVAKMKAERDSAPIDHNVAPVSMWCDHE